MIIETDTKQVYKSKLEIRQANFKTYVASYTAHNMYFESAEHNTEQKALESVMVLFVEWLQEHKEGNMAEIKAAILGALYTQSKRTV